MSSNLVGWLSLSDLDAALKSAKRYAAGRFARRNVRIQSEDVMWKEDFDRHVREGDAAAKKLRALQANKQAQ